LQRIIYVDLIKRINHPQYEDGYITINGEDR